MELDRDPEMKTDDLRMEPKSTLISHARLRNDGAFSLLTLHLHLLLVLLLLLHHLLLLSEK